jgi:Cu/Ag efflux protein CusF
MRMPATIEFHGSGATHTMQTLKILRRLALCGAAVLAATGIQAQTLPAQPASAAQALAPDMTDGEVRKVDKDTRKITLKHGEIKNLDMPPMTMVFQVSDPALLDKVKPGDKVRFMAGDEAGKLTVKAIQVVK